MNFEHPDINKQAKMKKLINNQKVRSFFNAMKPFLSVAVLLIVLRYTGAISGISYLGGSAMIKTGLLDADPAAEDISPANFNYDFEIQDLEGKVIDFNQFKGKVVFLNLWATWCGPCRVEMPAIQSLYNSVDTTKIKFVMLSLDKMEHHKKIVNYISEKGFTFPVYQPLGSLTKQLQVRSIPTTFVIGVNGEIKSKEVGTTNFDTKEFRTYLQGLGEETVGGN
jgi:thiol-disulfide isomerase/thioredoxin